MFADLNSISLANLSQVTVTPSASNVDRSYGRRFTVTIGTDSQEVVFKDLYKTARRLMKETKTSSCKDLNDVSAFISKLEGVETQAIATYEGRDDTMYKFRSWFHRFFGGAFRGTHLGRLTKLQNKLALGAQSDFSAFIKANSRYFAFLSQGMEVDVSGKKFHVEWKKVSHNEGSLNIWDKANPSDVASCNLNFNNVTYNNFEIISSNCASIVYAIEQEVTKAEDLNDTRRFRSEHNTAGFRDELMEAFKSLLDLCPDDAVFQNPILPIIKDGKTYSIKITTVPTPFLNIQETGNAESVLEIRSGHSTYDGLQDGIPDEFRPVLDDILIKINATLNEKRMEMAAFANRLKVSKEQESFTKSAALLNTQLGGQNFTITIDNKDFDAWKNGNFLNIQEKGQRNTNQGLFQIEVTTRRTGDNYMNYQYVENYGIKFEGATRDSMPIEVKHVFDAMVLEAYKGASSYISYLSTLSIKIIRESLALIPLWHLNQFYLSDSSSFSVSNIGESGVDAGGLKREYMGELASSLSCQKSLFAEADGSLKIPRIVRDQKEAVLYCDHEEQVIYQNIGKLFHQCYSSLIYDSITTGRLFSDVIFKAAFSLSENDLQRPFTQQRDAQIRMVKIILTYLDKQSANTVKNVIKCFDLLEEANLEKCLISSAVDLQNELLFAFDAIGTPANEVYENEDTFLPDIAKIKANKEQFKQDLFNALMKDPALVDELNGITLGSMIDPLYHIAMGMKSKFPNWNITRSGAVNAFSSKVQGTIDRNMVIVSIDMGWRPDGVITQKITWLKEWIKEASDDEIKSFLKFATGSTSLAGSNKISIDTQAEATPFISSSTCRGLLHMSDKMVYRSAWGAVTWDNTKEAFIRNLKTSMNTEGFQMR